LYALICASRGEIGSGYTGHVHNHVVRDERQKPGFVCPSESRFEEPETGTDAIGAPATLQEFGMTRQRSDV